MTEPDDEWITLHGRTPAGQAATWRVRVGERLAATGSDLATREAFLDDGTRLLRRSLPGGPGLVDRHAEQLLDNEIRSLIRLAASYPSGPDFFPVPVGYNVDTDDPFLLVAEYGGSQAQDVVGTLLHEERTRFAVSLLRAIALTCSAGLVHGNIDQTVLRIDGGVRIATWERAMLAGETRRGGAPAHPGDDIRAAAHVLYQVYCGTPLRSAADLDSLPALRGALQGTMDAAADGRPTAVEVLARLGFDPPEQTPEPLEADLEPGRQRFDQLREDKLAALRPSVVSAEPPRRRRKAWSLFGTAMVFTAVSLVLPAVSR
jgi:hypothetical protein